MGSCVIYATNYDDFVPCIDSKLNFVAKSFKVQCFVVLFDILLFHMAVVFIHVPLDIFEVYFTQPFKQLSYFVNAVFFSWKLHFLAQGDSFISMIIHFILEASFYF